MKYRRVAGPKKIGPYEAILRNALAADARRPRRERRTARKLYAQLQAQGFRGSYARVTEFIRGLANGAGRRIGQDGVRAPEFRVGRGVPI
jgi:hypothetical protein